VSALCGCRVEIEPEPVPDRICTGQKNVGELLEVLRRRWPSVRPFKASGQCLLQYVDIDGAKRRENFPVRVWAEPPSRFCLHGNVGFNDRGIEFGSNEQEFWLAIRPRQVNGYWWGARPAGDGSSASFECWAELPLGLSPQDVLDGFGLARPGQENINEDWHLSNEGPFDILTQYDKDGRVVRKLYVNCCDFLFYRIEYFDLTGRLTALMRLAKYEHVSAGFMIPSEIEIVHYAADDKQSSLRIRLSSVKEAGFSKKQQQRLFTRPASKRFKQVLRLDENCRFVRENH